jgi:hypothetical protein
MTKATLVFACGVIFLFQSATKADSMVDQTSYDANHGGRIETKYDGFNLETVIRLQKMSVTCSSFKEKFKDACASIDVVMHLPGAQLDKVRYVTFQIIFETKNWDQAHGFDQRDLSIVADLETFRFGRMRLVPRTNTLLSETMVETLETTVPYPIFKKIAMAQFVELQVGRSRVQLKEKNRAALRDLNSRIITTQ